MERAAFCAYRQAEAYALAMRRSSTGDSRPQAGPAATAKVCLSAFSSGMQVFFRDYPAVLLQQEPDSTWHLAPAGPDQTFSQIAVPESKLRPRLVAAPRHPDRHKDMREIHVLVLKGVHAGKLGKASRKGRVDDRVTVNFEDGRNCGIKVESLHIEPGVHDFIKESRACRTGRTDSVALEEWIDLLLKGIAFAEAEQLSRDLLFVSPSLPAAAPSKQVLELRVGMYVLSLDHMDAGLGLILASMKIDGAECWRVVLANRQMCNCKGGNLVPWLLPLPEPNRTAVLPD